MLVWGVKGAPCPVGTEPFLMVEFKPVGTGVVPRGTEGALKVLSGVSSRLADVLSTEGCLELAIELLSLPVALEYLSTLESLLGGLL